MEIVDFICEVSGCYQYANIEINLPDSQVLLCSEHNEYSASGEGVLYLTDEEVQRVLNNIKMISAHIRVMKLKTIKRAEEIVSFINLKTSEKIRELNEIEKKCTQIWDQIKIWKYCFRKILKNIEENSNSLVLEPCLYLEKFFNIIKNGVGAELSVSHTEKIIIIAGTNRNFYTFLSDSRLLCSTLPIADKLRLLGKTNFIDSLNLQINDYKKTPKMDEYLKNVLDSPKHLVIVTKFKLLLIGHDKYVEIKSLSNLILIHMIILPTNLVDIILDPSNDFFTIISYSNIEKFNFTTMSSSSNYSHAYGQFHISKPYSNNSKVVLGNYDGYLWIFKIKKFTFIYSCKAHNGSSVGPIICIGVFELKKFIVFSDIDYKVKLWINPGIEQKVVQLFGNKGKINFLAFSPDAHFLVGICDNLEVKVWNCFEKFKPHSSLTVKIENPCMVLFSKDYSDAVVYNGKKGVVFKLFEKKVKGELLSLSLGVSSLFFINTSN